MTHFSFPGIRSISRLAAASVWHTTASVLNADRTLSGLKAFKGKIRLGSGVASPNACDSSSKCASIASFSAKTTRARRQGRIRVRELLADVIRVFRALHRSRDSFDVDCTSN